MSIFLVITIAPNTALETAIKERYQNQHLVLSPERQWLIFDEGIAQQVSDRLEISDGKFGDGIVFAISGYYGWALNSVWEWLAKASETPKNV